MGDTRETLEKMLLHNSSSVRIKLDQDPDKLITVEEEGELRRVPWSHATPRQQTRYTSLLSWTLSLRELDAGSPLPVREEADDSPTATSPGLLIPTHRTNFRAIASYTAELETTKDQSGMVQYRVNPMLAYIAQKKEKHAQEQLLLEGGETVLPLVPLRPKSHVGFATKLRSITSAQRNTCSSSAEPQLLPAISQK